MRLSVILPVLELGDYHRQLTDFAIKNLRATADAPFELVVVETGPTARLGNIADVHVHCPERTCVASDMNLGLEAATSEIVVQSANDLVLGRGWDTALLAPWARFPDCGASTLLATSHAGQTRERIEEGFYGPVMAFASGWRFDDERFPNIFSDTDLVMRLYREGKRMYRNWSVAARHLCGGEQTWREVAGAERGTLFAAARERFREQHQDCGLMMFRALYEGWRI